MSVSSMRSALFVPALRPDRIPKALASGADAVIVDLEDTVAPESKAQARHNLATYAATHGAQPLWVRINDATTPWFEDDLALCRSLATVCGIVLPKAQAAEQVYRVSGAGKPLIPVVESAAGLRALDALAQVGSVVRLSFGMLDIMVDFGTRPGTDAARMMLDQVRFRILEVSRAHGLGAPLDGVQADFTDLGALRASARFARDLGFAGMLCIHPAQVPIVHEVYCPLPEEIDWARRVIAHADSTGEYAFRLDGSMVDLPLIERARRILEQST
ncbi:CoA ester lyase [Castellaniella sp.]|uniref:HpcH/HpaI aldolase/citrate lyase family protein n=1 Tax=Castellaniella sp. TaxID=1955812 RepID=UPI00355E1B27